MDGIVEISFMEEWRYFMGWHEGEFNGLDDEEIWVKLDMKMFSICGRFN